MSRKAASIRSAIADFMLRNAIPGEMEQNLVKEAIHLHLLSALSDAGVLRRAVFQGGTALRLCYGGERYSEDLDFVCGAAGAYLEKAKFNETMQDALQTARRTLARDFDIAASEIAIRQPVHPMAIAGRPLAVVAWQMIVPIDSTPRSPKSRVKVEFANVPSYDHGPRVARAAPGLVQVQDVILAVESPKEILADKAVALTARERLKFRDVWDVWELTDRLKAPIDRDLVRRKLVDYGTAEIEAKARARINELAQPATVDLFLQEMMRFLPAKRAAEMRDTGLHRAIAAESAKLLGDAVLDNDHGSSSVSQ